MTRNVILAGLLAGLLACSTGCGVIGTILRCPFGPGTMCDSAYCGPSCTADCGPSCGACRGAPCAAEPCASCEPCGDPCCGPCCGACIGPVRPLRWLWRLFHPVCWDGGCGDVYWGDFHGAPPDCCDPCDRLGNWSGGGYGGSVSGGCEHCADSGVPSAQASQIISQTDRVVEPAKAESVAQAAPPRPARTRR